MSARAEGGNFVVDVYEGCHLAANYGSDGVPSGWTAIYSDSGNTVLAGMQRRKNHIRWSVSDSNEIRLAAELTVTEDGNIAGKATWPGGRFGGQGQEIEAYEDITFPFTVGTAKVILCVWEDDLILVGIEGQKRVASVPARPASVEFHTDVIHSSGVRLHTEWLRLTAKGTHDTQDADEHALHSSGAWFSVVEHTPAGLQINGTSWQISKPSGMCARDLANALKQDSDAVHWEIEASQHCLPAFGTLGEGAAQVSGGRDAFTQPQQLRFLVSRNNNVLGFGFLILIYDADTDQKHWTVTVPAQVDSQWFEVTDRSLPCNYELRLNPISGVPMNPWVSTHIRLVRSKPKIC